MFNKDSLLKFLETKSVSFTLYQHARVFSKADLANMPKTVGEVLKSLVLTNSSAPSNGIMYNLNEEYGQYVIICYS